MTPIIEIQNLSKIFSQRRKKTTILDDVNLVVKK
jgi:predicted ABC-type transport system involved in lysophospholipase L1 biosynthesis ATPase subunit